MKKIINIYGDITPDAYLEGDMSSSKLSGILESYEDDVDEIEVYINSLGGSVAEGLSIYNQLKNHPAKVKTICNGFACSIASIIFLAGDERALCENSMFMVHNAWTVTAGNSNDLKKEAEVLEKITQQSVNIYCQRTGLEEDKVKEMMDSETWLDSIECLELGFATQILKDKEEAVSQSVKKTLKAMIKQKVEVPKEELKDIVVEEIKEQQDIVIEEIKQEEKNVTNTFLKIFN